MVEWNDTTDRARRRAAWWAGLTLAAGTVAPGCGLVSKTKLDDCHHVSQTLRSENSRLKDVALDLRAQTQDLSQRAEDDGRKITEQEEAVARLESSVHAYQAEREQMAAALEAVKRQVRIAASPHEAANPARLKAFALAHPGWTFDDARLALAAPATQLFESQADQLRPEAAETLKTLGEEFSGPGADALVLEVAAPALEGVEKAGYEPKADGNANANGRFLAAARAARVRDRLVVAAGLDPASARLVPSIRRGDQVEIRIQKKAEETGGAKSDAARP